MFDPIIEAIDMQSLELQNTKLKDDMRELQAELAKLKDVLRSFCNMEKNYNKLIESRKQTKSRLGAMRDGQQAMEQEINQLKQHLATLQVTNNE